MHIGKAVLIWALAFVVGLGMAFGASRVFLNASTILNTPDEEYQPYFYEIAFESPEQRFDYENPEAVINFPGIISDDDSFSVFWTIKQMPFNCIELVEDTGFRLLPLENLTGEVVITLTALVVGSEGNAATFDYRFTAIYEQEIA